ARGGLLHGPREHAALPRPRRPQPPALLRPRRRRGVGPRAQPHRRPLRHRGELRPFRRELHPRPPPLVRRRRPLRPRAMIATSMRRLFPLLLLAALGCNSEPSTPTLPTQDGALLVTAEGRHPTVADDPRGGSTY